VSQAKPWDDIIDQHALAVNRSLRMQGSRKVRKDTDIGRVYERLVVLDGSGNVDPAAMSRYAADEVAFLRRVSLCFSQGPQTPLRPSTDDRNGAEQ